MSTGISIWNVEWWQRVKHRAFRVRTTEPRPSAQASDLHKVLTTTDLIFLGIGGIIGAGVFVLTGVAARQEAGPAVVLSYMVASLAAILSGLCYTEFSVDTPVAGGAYVFVSMSFGELVGWVAATNLLLEYALGGAAIARSLTSYLGALLANDANLLRLQTGSELFLLDFPALVAVIIVSLLLGLGTTGGAKFNTLITTANLAVIAFVLVTGLPRVNPDNFLPFAPFGMRGIFSGASKVFFSYIGFDTISTAAEEAKDPAVAVPWGVLSSLLICAGLYSLMCVTICGMVPYFTIDVNAPFAAAYSTIGVHWAGKVVAVGALAGIITSLLVNLFGQIRLLFTLGREGLLPESLGFVNEKTRTPLMATAVTAISVGVIAVVVDLEALADLVSIGALSVFFLVSLACIWRRYCHLGSTPPPWLRAKLAIVLLASVGMSVAYVAGAHDAVTLVCLGMVATLLYVTTCFPVHLGSKLLPHRFVVALSDARQSLPFHSAGVWAIATGSLYCGAVVWTPAKFAVPLSPLTPSLAVLANMFLVASLGPAAYLRFAIWLILALIIYGLYCVKHERTGVSFVDALSGSGQEQELVATDAVHALSTSMSNPASPRMQKEGLGTSTRGQGISLGAFDATVDTMLDEA